MIPYMDQSSSTDKRKRITEASPQPLSRLAYLKAWKFSEIQQLVVQPVIRRVMLATLVQPAQPIQPVLPVQSVSYIPVLPISFPNQPIQFGTGTTSTAVLTKTQRKNRIKRIKKRMMREKKEKEDEAMCETSLLQDDSRFHALSATKGEEDVEKMDALSPMSLKAFKELAPGERTEKLEQQSRGVFQWTTEKSIITKEEIIRRLKGMVSQSLLASLMEEQKTSVDNTVVVQPHSGKKQRFARDGNDIESQPRLTDSEETLLVDNIVSSPECFSKLKVSNQTHQMVSGPSISNTTKFEVPLTPKEDGSSIPFDKLQVQDHTFTSLSDGKSLSLASQVPSSSIGHANSMIEKMEHMEVNIDQEYVSSPIDHEQLISEMPIKELMDDLRASLHKMDEEGSDKDIDDLMDEELYGVNSGSSSLPGDRHTDELSEVEVEEDGNSSLIRQLLRQLKRKDEYIMKIEKRMEEMTKAMIALIIQSAGSQQTSTVEKPLASVENIQKMANVDDKMVIQSRKDSGSNPHHP